MAKTVLFDFDGVIADTETIHMNAFRKALDPQGIKFSYGEYFSRYLALDDKTFFETLLTENGGTADAETVSALVREKSAITESQIARCELFDGVGGLIRSLAAGGLVLAVASGALRGEITAVLSRAKLLEFFACIVSAEDCKNCKPDPEPFLRALDGVNRTAANRIAANRAAVSATVKSATLSTASTLSTATVKPEECVVIEDSVSGIKAAKAAGMKCVAVANSHPREMLSEANLTVESALELNTDLLTSL